MLAAVRIEIKRGGIRHVASGIVRYNRNVIAYLVLHRIPFKRCKRITDCNIGRPGNATVSAPRVEQLRIGVVCSVSRVHPYRIDPSVGRYCEGTEPMPFVLINRIVCYSLRLAKRQSTIRAASKHHIASITCAELLHRSHHINIVVGRSAGAVYHQKDLAG